MGLLALAASSVLAGPALSAAAAPTTAVTIDRTSPSPQESGETFVYEVKYQCSDVDGSSCSNNVITIPLGEAAGFDVSVSEGFPVASSAVVGTDLIITLEPSVPAGTSSTIQLSLTPPNYTTPNGTTWSLLPVVTGTDTPTSSAPTPADGTSTAELVPTIGKSVVPAFAQPGEVVTWTIEVGCYLEESGSLYAQSMTVTDPLPAGFIFDSASGGGVHNAGTVTWTYPDAASLPASCTDGTSAGTISQTITGTVSSSQAPNTSIVNTAEVSAVPFGGGEPVTANDDANVSVYDDENPPLPGPITLSKTGQGQLSGPFQSDSPFCLQDCWSTTYPGNWMGVPETAETYQGGPGYPVTNPSAMNWSGYATTLGIQGDGFQSEFRDPMPCIENYTDPVYSQSSGVCENPAFHATMITVYNQPITGHSNGNWVSTLVPYAVLTDGSTVDLVLQGSPPANAYMAFYQVPASAIGRVAEIVVPRNAGATGFIKRFYIGGYADKSIPDGSILENYSHATLYWGDSPVPSADPTSTRGRIFVINAPQIGATKSFGELGAADGGATALSIGGELATIGEPSENLVITDLLPVGMKLVGNATTATLDYKITTGDDSGQAVESGTQDFPMEVVNNYQGSGRQLVRITVDQAYLASQAGTSTGESGTKYSFTANSLAVTTPTEPGIYNNRASVFYDRDDLASTCLSFLPEAPSDAGDLDGNSDTTDHHCDASASLTIPGSVPGPGFSVKKTVQGSSDAFPRVWPSVARVDAEGGTVQFGLTWKNTATDPLNGVVLYDVFPRVGDTGVSASLAEQGRSSEFSPLLTGVGALPAGVSISYSTALNPCRDEVYPDSANTTCVDDWTSTAPADLTTVTAIRLTSENTYASGEEFTVDFTMTTPSINEGDIAWNSVAGRANSALTGDPLLASEPPKVGITAVGDDLPPEIQKTVDKASAVPGDTLTYTMTVANLDVVRLTNQVAVDTLPAGVTFVSASDGGEYSNGRITWAGLNIESGEYKVLTVQVTVNPGVSGELINKFTIDGAFVSLECPDDPTQSCATTTVAGSSLIVRKVVTGEAASYASGPYTISVDCRAAGASVAGFPQDVVFEGAGDSDPIAAPLGATCVAAETETGGATGVTLSPTDGIQIVSGSPESLVLTLTNEFRAGSLIIAKSLAGSGATDFGAGPFDFSVVCSFDGRDSVYEGNLELQRMADEVTLISDPITGLPIGAVCVVTETDNGGADATPAPVTITIAENESQNTVTAAFVNEFSAGSVSLSKVLAGNGAETPDALESVFTVRVTCEVELPGEPSTRGTVFSGAIDIRGGDTVLIEDADGNPLLLPIGTHCWADETDQGGASESAVNFDSYENAAIVTVGSPDDLQELELTATNTFVTAELVVSKTVVGPGASGPYTFAVECTREGVEYILDAGNDEFTLSHGESRTIVVGAGVDCVVTELNPPTGATVSVIDSDASSGGGASDGVVLNIAGVASVDVTNTFAEIPVVTPPGVTPPGVTPPGVKTPVLVNTGLVVGGGIAAGAALLLLGGVLMLVSRSRREKAEANH